MESNEQYKKMIETPVPKLIVSLAIPTIISMMVTSIYNMADTFFVSKLGVSASGAIGIVFSLMAIIQAIGFMIGMGGGSTISRLLGQGKKGEADKVASSALFASIVFGILLAVIGIVNIDNLMIILGATDTILPYARDYAQYILLAAPVMAASFVLNNILRSEGKAQFAMIGITIGGILNIVLDPLFIFTFDMGIAGAAIATAISQLVSFIVLLSCFLMGKTSLKLKFSLIAPNVKIYLLIMKNGLPSFCRQGLASISTVSLNSAAALSGDPAVAAMSIVGKIFMMVFSVAIGFGQGFQPVIGYNYGAGKDDRVKKSFVFTLQVGFAIMTFFGVIGFIFAPQIMEVFISDREVIEIGTKAFRAQSLVMPLMPLGVVCNMTFQSIGKAWTATILSACRQGIFFLPLILTLPYQMGILGVQLAQPIADIFTFMICMPFVYIFYKDLSKRKLDTEYIQNTGTRDMSQKEVKIAEVSLNENNNETDNIYDLEKADTKASEDEHENTCI